MDLVSSAVRSEVSMMEPVYAASAIADAGTMPGLHAELGARPVSMKTCPAEDVHQICHVSPSLTLPGNCVYLRHRGF